MNKIIFSRWEPTYFAELEFYLDNADKIVLKYKETKCIPNTIRSINGREYSIVKNTNGIIGFIEI